MRRQKVEVEQQRILNEYFSSVFLSNRSAAWGSARSSSSTTGTRSFEITKRLHRFLKFPNALRYDTMTTTTAADENFKSAKTTAGGEPFLKVFHCLLLFSNTNQPATNIYVYKFPLTPPPRVVYFAQKNSCCFSLAVRRAFKVTADFP